MQALSGCQCISVADLVQIQSQYYFIIGTVICSSGPANHVGTDFIQQVPVRRDVNGWLMVSMKVSLVG